jgi:hypothetical protein
MPNEDIWPCPNCGAAEEFGPNGCGKSIPFSLILNRYCASYRAEMDVLCRCDFVMHRRGDVWVCDNCHEQSLTVDQVRTLVAKYGEALTTLAGTLPGAFALASPRAIY